jgi:amidase
VTADTIHQQIREIREAYDIIKSKAKKFVDNVDLISPDEFTVDGENSEEVITRASFLGMLYTTCETDSFSSGRYETKSHSLS